MGYSYGVGPSGRWVLSCSLCGAANGDSRKIPCPFDWCQATATCAKCRANPETRAKYLAKKAHQDRGCEENHKADQAKRAERNRRLVAGEQLRCSARNVDGDLTQVVFANPFQGLSTWMLMAPATYRAVPWDADSTVEDFQKHGRVVSGPVGYATTPEEIQACHTAWECGGVAEGTNIQVRAPEPVPEPPCKPVKVRAGQTFRLAHPIKFSDGAELDTFTLLKGRNLVMHAGRRYRLRNGWRRQAIAILPAPSSTTNPNA